MRASFVDGEFIVWPSVAVGVLVVIVSLLIGAKRGDVEVDVALASLTTFLFGVLLAFTIARTRDRLVLIQDLVAKGNASLLSIYQIVAVFDVEDTGRVRTLIDRQLTEQIDFRLVDKHLSTASHIDLTDAIYALNPTTRQAETAYKELIKLGIDMSADRTLIEAVTGQELSPMEWTGLLLLLLLLIALITVLPGGTVLGALAAGVLAGTLVTLMILLRKLDRLRWHERVSIWEPTSRLFRSMGQDPYVPREVIVSGRYRPTGRVRVVDYPDPYPNRSTKVVTVEDFGMARSPGAHVS
ncbi:MAG: hypothetical protein WBG41_05045 [Acidimicrobiales bacterium]